MSTVIRVEGLSKRYIIGHQRQESYNTLRDTISQGATRFGRRLSHPFRSSSGQPLMGVDEAEEFWALKDVSFEVKQGDRVGIIGSNGAGKSTLLKMLSRITEPTKGRITIKGRIASLLEVGTGFHPELSGRENIFLNGAVLGMSKAEIKRKFDEIVAFSGVEKFLDTPVKRYSSGMYVRLAFAVAAHLEPEILIVDEVLAVGDVGFQSKCIGKMDQVSKEGRTVLFVSHNMGAINRLCSSCYYLRDGCVVDSGATSDVVKSYLGEGFSGQGAEVFFSGGEEDDLQFLSARTIGPGGEPSKFFRSDENVRLSVTYKVKKRLFGASLSMVILTNEQESLWSTTDWDVYPELLECREPGVWTGEWVVPANVLRPGRYFVALGAGSPSSYYHHPEYFPFEITPEGTWRRAYQQFGVSGAPLAMKMEVVRPYLVANEDV